MTTQDPNGKGYCPNYGQPDQSDGGTLIAHPKDSEGVRQAFTSFHTRKFSSQGIADMLNQAGYRTRTRHPFTGDSVCDLLRNRFYAQWVIYKGEQHRGSHPALAEQKVFDDCQAILSEHVRSPRSQPNQQRFFLLSGLVRCSRCGYIMTGHTNWIGSKREGRRKEKRFYRDRADLMGFECEPRLVDAVQLEAAVGDHMQHIRLPPAWKERIMVLTRSDPVMVEMDRQRRELRSHLKRLQQLYVKGDTTAEEYERTQRLIKRKLATLEQPSGQTNKRVEMCLEDFGGLWNRLSREVKKEMVYMLVKAVYVKNGSFDHLELHPPFKTLLLNQDMSKSNPKGRAIRHRIDSPIEQQ